MGESVENFMKIAGLYNLVKGFANISYEVRRFTHKKFASSQIFYHLKLLLSNLWNVSINNFFTKSY